MQGAYADAAITVAQALAAQAVKEFRAMAVRIRAILEVPRLPDVTHEAPIGRQMFHAITAAHANVEDIRDLVAAIGHSPAPPADLINQSHHPKISISGYAPCGMVSSRRSRD